jgi:hypothetical protein
MTINSHKIMLHLPLTIFHSHWKNLLIALCGSSFFLVTTAKGMAQGSFGAVPLPPPSTPQGSPLNTTTPQIDFSQNNNTPIPVEFEYQSPQVPPTYINTTNTNAVYRVEVEGASSSLLELVRTVEPTAFTRRGEGVIQVGLFRDALNAQNMIQKLSAIGVTAKIVQISGNNNSGLNSSSLNIYGEIQNEGYFVIIPGEMNSLVNIAGRVKQSGIPDNALRLRSAPLGPHVAVGPFGKRDEAERWNSYLRSVGLDARVYFGH